MSTYYNWTESLTLSLRVRWKNGVSTEKIAQILGFTKSAVCGKARRLNLAIRGSPILRNSPRKVYQRVEIDKRTTQEYRDKMSAIMKKVMERSDVREKIGKASTERHAAGTWGKEQRVKNNNQRRIVFDDVLTASLIDLRVNKKLPWVQIEQDMGICIQQLRKQVKLLRTQGIKI